MRAFNANVFFSPTVIREVLAASDISSGQTNTETAVAINDVREKLLGVRDKAKHMIRKAANSASLISDAATQSQGLYKSVEIKTHTRSKFSIRKPTTELSRELIEMKSSVSDGKEVIQQVRDADHSGAIINTIVE